MRRILLSAVALLMMFAAARVQSQTAAQTGRAGWTTDFTTAEAESKRLGRPLLVHFYATWCPPCRRMEQETLHTPDVLRKLGTSFVAVKVNGDQHPELAQRFQIRPFPSDVFVDPFSGKVISRSEGFLDAASYTGLAARIERRFEESQRIHVAKTQTPVPQAPVHQAPAPQTAAPRPQESPLTPPPLVAQPKAPAGPATVVGLDGYSPVALWAGRKWTKGTPQHAYEYKGLTYYFADSHELNIFKSDPARYAPRLLGCDPVILWETDRALPGSVRYGAFYDEELYLFTTVDNRARFKENPARYARTQHVINLDRIERTAVR